jgi:hypothetical protein
MVAVLRRVTATHEFRQGSPAAAQSAQTQVVNSIWIPSGSTKSNVAPSSPATFRTSERATPQLSSQLAHSSKLLERPGFEREMIKTGMHRGQTAHLRY